MPGEAPAALAMAVERLAELATDRVPDAAAKAAALGLGHLGHGTHRSRDRLHRRAHGAIGRSGRLAADRRTHRGLSRRLGRWRGTEAQAGIKVAPMAAMCAGVEPQQPPTRSIPSSASRVACIAMSPAVAS